VKATLALVCSVFIAAAAALPATSGTLRTLDVSGVWVPSDFGTTSCRSAASLLFCATSAFRSDYTGSLTGASRSDFVQVNNCVTGHAQGIGLEKFTGSIAGLGSGTLTWVIRFSSALAPDCFTPTSFEGDGFITSGTGALARVRGSLHFTFDGYTGTLRVP
jgi:hypothetical protein